MLTVDAPSPGDLEDRDVDLLTVMAGLAAIAMGMTWRARANLRGVGQPPPLPPGRGPHNARHGCGQIERAAMVTANWSTRQALNGPL